MFVVDPDGSLPKGVRAAMEHAERHGAKAAACTVAPESLDDRWTHVLDTVGMNPENTIIFSRRPGPLPIQDRDFATAFAFVVDPPEACLPALTLAGFRPYRHGTWRWLGEAR